MVYVGLFLVVQIDHAMRLLLPDWFGLHYAPPSLALLTALYRALIHISEPTRPTR